ncbi:MAG TPA: putative toxin-antitoxin system toxin component, PIN family [Acidobacteriaceae bacterium]|nr:putative toxin-antitoxin system toxin component, PIN family [Acidobacteriaceae bacterium]
MPGTFLDLALLQSFLLVTSPALLDELDEKLRLKFGLSPNDADLVRAQLQSSAMVVKPTVILEVIKDDPDDNRVLECAAAGEANCIVSGDRHLLQLSSYEGIPILTVRQFMDAVETGS